MSRSPFTPGYGVQPLVFGGHVEELAAFRRAFEDYDFGDRRSILLSGLRGAGKTSMLLELQAMAEEAGWIVISDNASSGMYDRITKSLIPDVVNRFSEEEQRQLVGLGIWQFQADFLVRDTRRPVETLLRQDLQAISEATDGRGILFTIDEVAAGRSDKRELRDLAMELAHAANAANIVAVFAGVKLDIDELVREQQLTFLQRSHAIDFRRLSPPETQRVLTETARLGGREIESDALPVMLSISQGYPYLVQLIGDIAWRQRSEAETVSKADAEAASGQALEAVFDRVISRAYDDLSPRDRMFVRAMAQVGDRAKMADVIEKFKEQMAESGEDPEIITPQYAQQYRMRLIDSGYAEADGRGYIRFLLPYLGDYVRAMLAEERGELVDERAPVTGWDAYPPPQLR